MDRKIKDPAISYDYAVKTMDVLMNWCKSRAINDADETDELRDRANTAINALGNLILGHVEEQYAPVERKFSVTVEVTETRRENTIVTAADENEASMKALDGNFDGAKASVVSVCDLGD